MSEKRTEIIPTQGEGSLSETALPAIVDTNIVAIAEQAEARLEALVKIKRVALKSTNPHDWVDESGKPYLQSSGAEKVARVFGVSWRIFEPSEEDLGAGHYMITYKGEFALGGAIITAIGTRSSKDGFFKKYKYVGDERVELPVSEIDKGDVKKSAYTNLLANGITRLLGIRNLTYEDLQAYAGIKKEQVVSVEYKKRGKAPSSQASKVSPPPGNKDATPPESPEDPATQEQTQAINAILEGKGITGDFEKMQSIKSVLELEGEVPTSIASLTKNQAQTAIAALQKGGG